jgi:WD40-like Beta Propeller Repeat
VKPTGHIANAASTPEKTGPFATLVALVHRKGSGAPSSRRARVTLSILVPAVAALACSAAPALAAPEAPVTTSPAKSITGTSAIFEGTLNPHSKTFVGGYFAYSDPEGLICMEGPSAGLEGFEEKVGEALAVHTTVSLQPDRKYKFCLIAYNQASEITQGNEVPVTTPAIAPSIESESTSGGSSTTITLEAQVNPNNEKTSAHLQYSTSSTVNGSGSLTTPTVPASSELGEGYGGQTIGNGALSGLPAGTTFYYQAVATNATGTTYGTVQSFTTVPTPNTDPVNPFAATTATFNGHLKLTPGIEAKYSFDYNVGTECTGGNSTTRTEATTPTVSAAVTELVPHTTYTVCLVTSNAFGSEQGQPVSFKSLAAAPAISAEHATEVTATSAQLGGEIDPGGAETTYRFEYGTSAAYDKSTPESASIGSDNSEHAASATIQELTPGTEYHYRLVATNGIETVYGADQAFKTQGAGGPVVLPDGRQWELVSPPQKNGAQVFPITDAVMQAAEDGSAITYYMTNAFVDEAPGNAIVSQALSKRSPSGWSTQDIAPSHKLPVGPNSALSQSEDVFFAADLTTALLQPSEEEGALSEEVERNLYLRNNSEGTLTPLLTAANLLPGTDLTEGEKPDLSFITATPDLKHVIFTSTRRLTAEGPENNYQQLYDYEWSATGLKLINVNNIGEETQIGSYNSGGNENKGSNERHSISNDGARVFWSQPTNGFPLYMTDMDTGTVTRVNTAQGVTEPAENRANFQIASSDGSRVFFTDTEQLTPAPGAGLYDYNSETGKLTLVTLPEVPGEDVGQGFAGSTVGAAGVVEDVIGASEDGSYLYVVANDVLAGNNESNGEKATADADNLYQLHDEVRAGVEEWKASFITMLAPEDSPDWSGNGFQHFLTELTARVSPNGRYLAFMSDRDITGYDNRDANSGQPDEEIYLYDAQSGRLACGSCNPTGARPVGRLEAGRASSKDLQATWAHHWVAASIPGWLAFSGDSALYQPRYLSDDGRLFFDTSDGLVPQDTNGAGDVYEYEPAGIGSCANTDSTYSPKAGGCISLISGGAGEEESVFVDASVSGDDVFFTTVEGLVGNDLDRASDMYNAHVCSVEVPCLPAPVATPPPCETADSCKAAPSPQPAIFGSPASATFSGAGNPAPPPTVVIKVTKKATKCKRGFVKKKVKKTETCVRKPKKKQNKAKKSAHINRRASR